MFNPHITGQMVRDYCLFTMSNNAQLINTYNKMKKTFKIIHVKELFVNDAGDAVFQIKLQNKQVVIDALGTGGSQETYYRKVTNPKVQAGQEVELDVDNYDIVVEQFETDDDKIIKLKYLYNKR
jgi:hypothetical protein